MAPDVAIGARVVIHAGSQVGAGAVLEDGAVVGKQPHLGAKSTAARDPVAPAVVEEGAAVLAGAVVFAGARLGPRSIVGDQSHVRERARLGADTVIGRGSSIDNDVVVGERVRIQTNCYITAYCTIEDDVFIGPGVITTNDNTMARQPLDAPLEGPVLRRASRIGGGAIICPGVEVGEDAYVAAGAVVAGDVPSHAAVMGIPAREVRGVPDQDLLERWQ